ncbi:hybrid sensor histidine kinase/response regulator [Azohydromonas caseinilytica]|uniref:Virulence sensor protein BvgS n=1 Tax=Azohydromonas caseinilytica TaxID=2728836 RepID=A0A848FEE6_9BURK|nr:ATP-binding protein [Azohydromonas caseinilytica]NML16271.1 response regulator [Azohydromonas caseinilytica]
MQVPLKPAPPQADPGLLPEVQQDVRPRVARFFFATAAATAGGCAALLALPGVRLPGAQLLALLLALLLLCGVSLHALRGCTEALDAAVRRVSLAALPPIALLAWLVDRGVQGSGTAFLALLACLCGAVASRRTAALVSALAAALLGALAWGEWAGRLPGHPGQPLALHVGLQALLLATGAAGGRLLHGVQGLYVEQGQERAQRFTALLSVAAGYYWETDAQCRLTRVLRCRRGGRFEELPGPWGQPLWELPALRNDAAALQALHAELQARRPLRELDVAWQAGPHAPRRLRISGEPRLDARGQFLGYWGVGRDVTVPRRAAAAVEAERERARRRLEQALDQAQAASRAKSAFLANTSHELRTPLNALVGLAQLARTPGLGEVKRQQYLTQMLDSADTLMAVISDILDLSKIEAGKLDIHPQDFDLHALLQRLQRGYAAIARTHGLELTLDLDPQLPQGAHGDPVRLRQVLGNYLSNALKFTERGTVRLSARPAAGGRVRFEVEDTGPGLDADMQARLFQPFIQADDSSTRRHGGTGLGLSICRELAQLMGGEVGVDSRLGQGSRFWLELPLPAAAVPVEAPPAPAPAPAAPAQPLAGVRVLMVEDNFINMTISTAMLQQWGAQVTGAADGVQALEAVEQALRENRPFQAVLMDMQMPRMNGREATRELRRRFDAQALPIIALTAAALPAERDEALAAGMNDFLTKPIDAPKLLATLQRVLKV